MPITPTVKKKDAFMKEEIDDRYTMIHVIKVVIEGHDWSNDNSTEESDTWVEMTEKTVLLQDTKHPGKTFRVSTTTVRWSNRNETIYNVEHTNDSLILSFDDGMNLVHLHCLTDFDPL